MSFQNLFSSLSNNFKTAINFQNLSSVYKFLKFCGTFLKTEYVGIGNLLFDGENQSLIFIVNNK